MKKKTYRILTSVPIVGKVVANATDPSRSKLLFPMYGSVVNEMFANDPRGYKTAREDAFNKMLKPVHEYLEKHPDEQMTAGLIDKITNKK